METTAQDALSEHPEISTSVYCYCQKPDDDALDWIGGDNPTCSGNGSTHPVFTLQLSPKENGIVQTAENLLSLPIVGRER